MATEAERIATLEAHRQGHEDRHTRYEDEIKTDIGDIKTNIGDIYKILRNSNGQRGSLKRFGTPVVAATGGGGVLAIILLILEKLSTGG